MSGRPRSAAIPSLPELGYGATRVRLEGLPGTCLGVLAPAAARAGRGPAELVQAALDEPIASAPLLELARGARSAAILVSGKDRVTRADVFVPLLLRRLREAGVHSADVTVYMATGTHIRFSPEDRAAVFGDGLPGDVRVVAHDCKDRGGLVRLGTSRFGNEIWVSREACEADVKILTGRITHHYFAGFTAGRKAVLPGVSGLETIQRNHRLVLSGDGEDPRHPGARSGRLDGNPVHEEMLEAAAMFRPTFLLNTVLNTDHELTHVFGGDPVAAHEAGCGVVRDLFEVRVASPAPAAVASPGGDPYDCSFMQALKTVMQASPCVADGGGLLLLARCPEGILPAFLRWDRGLSLPALAREILRNYNLTGHNTYLLRSVLQRIHVVLVSDCPPAQVAELGLVPARSLEEGWELLRSRIGSSAPAYYAVPHGNVTAIERAA
jgi:nickel-dependent lactate racemase